MGVGGHTFGGRRIWDGAGGVACQSSFELFDFLGQLSHFETVLDNLCLDGCL